MKLKIVCHFMMVFLLVLPSCSNMSNDEKGRLPGIDVPISKLNTAIEIEIYPGMTGSFHQDEDLVLLIKNRSAKTIIFPDNFGIKIFVQEGDGWFPITNNWGYPTGTNVLPIDSLDPSGLAFFVYPDMSGIDSPKSVRVVVIGHIEDDGSKVGAFIDVQYSP